jgi:hypothetical protein
VLRRLLDQPVDRKLLVVYVVVVVEEGHEAGSDPLAPPERNGTCRPVVFQLPPLAVEDLFEVLGSPVVGHLYDLFPLRRQQVLPNGS